MSKTISNQSDVTYSYDGARNSENTRSNVVNSTMNDRYGFDVEKTASVDCFKAGETITYYIHVTKTGCGCLRNFHVCDNLGGCEGYLTYVEGSAKLFINGVMSSITPVSLSPLEFVVPNQIERDEEFVILFNVTVSSNISEEVQEITNEVCVKGYECDCGCESEQSDENCHTECDCLTLPRCQMAELLIEKDISRNTYCTGEELDYFITLTNIGNLDAKDVVVRDTMPEEFTATEVHMENNGVHYQFDPSEYDIDSNNRLTVPNATGTPILVPAKTPTNDNSTRLRIHGHV